MMHFDLFTIYLALVAAGLALSLVWLVVARTFPTLYAARYWFGGTLAAGTGSTLSVWHGAADPLLPILVGNGLVLLGSGLGWAGVREFNRKSTPWLMILGITGWAVLGLLVATVAYDSMELRTVIVSAAQSIMIGWAVIDILDRRSAKANVNLGRLTAAGACGALLLLNAARSVLAVLATKGELPFAATGSEHAGLIFLVAAFGALVSQFGLLLMTMDRLQAEMAQLAGMDELTGIANRRRFLAACEQERIRSIRSGRPFSVLVIDVDRFKAINDDHGHAAGDEYLKLLANTARAQLRSQDLLARLGGDEFSALLPETNGEQAARTADRLADAIRAISVVRDNVTITSTVSIGVAQWTPAVGDDPRALLEHADRALYHTKKGGRDGVTVAPIDTPPTLAPLAA